MPTRRQMLGTIAASTAAVVLPGKLASAAPKVDHTAPNFPVPAGACDCHVHIFGPAGKFPYSDKRIYTPEDAPYELLEKHLAAIKMDRVVIVQPSPYAADNRATLDGLARLGKRGRAVAVIDDGTSAADLEAFHKAGVRGVRVNLATSGVDDAKLARTLLEAAAKRVAPLGWHVQAYTELSVIAANKDAIAALPVPLVIDHFGRAQAAKGLDQPGLSALMDLLKSGKVYVKLSAPYRISSQPDYADAEALAKAMAAANPDRVVWGSDWPHPVGSAGDRDKTKIEYGRPEDDGAALNRMAKWIGEMGLRQKLFVDNAARLYQF